MRVLGVADSDSYVKWGAALLHRMPSHWHRELRVLRTPALPSEAQLAAALAGTSFARPRLLDLSALTELVARERPDVLFLSLRGPAIRVVVRAILAAGAPRPVIVSGLPGISIPETLNAVYYRSRADVFVLHSKREVAAFRALAARIGAEQEFALATLPFLGREARTGSGTDIVFAAQAIVPRALEERERLLDGLIGVARAQPHRRVVIKLRGLAGEPQTHAERHPFDTLLAQRPGAPANLVVATGPMSAALEAAGALLTVSSTAAIEAAAAGVPVLAIDDFGVTAALINPVFEGSGLLGRLSEAAAGRFRSPSPGWLDENYFHDPADETWIAAIESAVARRDAGALPVRPQFRGPVGGALRRAWDRKLALGQYDTSWSGRLAWAIGYPLRGTVRAARRVRARLLRRLG